MRYLSFLIPLLLIFGVNAYVFYRLAQMYPGTQLARIIIYLLGILLIASFFSGLIFKDSLPSWLISVTYNAGTSWFFISIYFLIAFLLLDFFRLTHLLPVSRLMYQSGVGFAVVVGGIALIFLLGNMKYHHKARVDLDLKVDKEQLDAPLKIVALSDLHLGYAIGRSEFMKWVELINAEKPDIVLIAGDIIDQTVRPLNEQNMAEVFSHIQSTYGIYAILGNHEYISDLHRSTAFYEAAGIHLLRDEATLINNRFYVVGRDDRSNKQRKALAEITDTLDHHKPIILLDHQPYHLEEAEAQHVDLQISGHTHYGQIWPISWITRAIYELPHGYKQRGNTHYYISSGIGLWGGKFRIGTQSEYVVITLR